MSSKVEENQNPTVLPVPKKTEYLARTFSRTKRKDFENYVLNAVWNRLAMPEIQPVSQQLVMAQDHHYFIDLYFPQINFGVECDEPYHRGQLEQDRQRLITIEDTFGAIREDAAYQCYRVNLSVETSDEVERQIDECVRKIRSLVEDRKLQGKFVPWRFDGREYEEYFADKDVITDHDDITFPTIAAACNTVFGTDYAGIQRGCFKPNTFDKAGYGDYVAWFPKMAVDGQPRNKNWNNTVDVDHEFIHQMPTEKWKNDPDFKPQTKPDGHKLVTFANMKDKLTGHPGYRFLGVYKTVECFPGGGDLKKQDEKEFHIIRPLN